MKNLVDIGASRYPNGNPMASRVSDNTQVYLFEPLDTFFEQLKQKYGSNKNYHLYDIALSDKKGEQAFYQTKKLNCSSLREPNPKNQIVKTREDLKEFTVKTVQVDTLENVLGHLDYIDFMKLDTQGTEYEILVGAGSLLERVKAIQCEVIFTEWYQGQKLAGEVDLFLEDAGFIRTAARHSHNVRHADYTYQNTRF